MEKLRESLKRITAWLQHNKPEYAANLNPGLTWEEIEEKVKHLPFKLPREVYELYQWHNGIAEFYPFHNNYFLPLEEALDSYAGMMEIEDYDIWNRNWFPLFSFDGQDFFFVAGDEPQKNTSPVLYVFIEGNELDIFCSSLTAMMLTVAEAFETGVYQFDRWGYLEIDEKKFSRLLRKNNPFLTDITLVQLQQAKQCLSLEMFYAFRLRLSWWYKEPRAVEPLIQLLQKKPWNNDLQHVEKIRSLQRYAATLLGDLQDSRAIAPLIDALKTEDNRLRICAATALGKLEGSEAVEPLINALNDGEKGVRNEAASSLLKLGAIESLVGALKSDSARIRFHAVKALAHLKYEQPQLSQLTEKMVIEAISQLLKDRDRSVRKQAKISLKRISSDG